MKRRTFNKIAAAFPFAGALPFFSANAEGTPNSRIFWAKERVEFLSDEGSAKWAEPKIEVYENEEFEYEVTNIKIDTRFDLEQIFELGAIELYDTQIPEIEVSIDVKYKDGYDVEYRFTGNEKNYTLYGGEDIPLRRNFTKNDKKLSYELAYVDILQHGQSILDKNNKNWTPRKSFEINVDFSCEHPFIMEYYNVFFPNMYLTSITYTKAQKKDESEQA